MDSAERAQFALQLQRIEDKIDSAREVLLPLSQSFTDLERRTLSLEASIYGGAQPGLRDVVGSHEHTLSIVRWVAGVAGAISLSNLVYALWRLMEKSP